METKDNNSEEHNSEEHDSKSHDSKNHVTDTHAVYDLLVRNTKEVIGGDEIQAKLALDKTLNVYWGTAPTSPPHLGYFVPLIKLRDFVRSGRCRVTVLLADVHSYLDEGITSFNRAELRTIFYEKVITSMLSTLGIPAANYDIVKGSQYQFDQKYCVDLLKFTSLLDLREAKRASSEVVKQTKNPLLSGLIYPLLQCLDETYFEADIQLGGNDQRKIFMLSRDHIEKLGYQKCAYLITPLVPALNSKGKQIKMSASCEASKICFSDTKEDIHRKLRKAYCVQQETDTDTSPVLALLKYVVFEVQDEFQLIREPKWGGNKLYRNYEEFQEDWVQGNLSAIDLKDSMVPCLDQLIAPTRELLMANPRWYEDAYGTLE